MRSRTQRSFWESYERLPASVKLQVRNAYLQFRDHPYHSSLNFKRVSQRRPVYSVRIGGGYRALGVLEDDTIIWFWVGTHNDYDVLIRRV